MLSLMIQIKIIYTVMKEFNRELKIKTVRLAHLLSEYLRSQGIDMWLEYGAALGAVREGGIIDGDLDIDFGIRYFFCF